MCSIAQNVSGQFISQFPRIQTSPGHLHFDRDPDLRQNKVDPSVRPGATRGEFLWPHIVKVESQERVENVLHVVFVCKTQRSRLVITPQNGNHSGKIPACPLQDFERIDRISRNARSGNSVENDLLLGHQRASETSRVGVRPGAHSRS